MSLADQERRDALQVLEHEVAFGRITAEEANAIRRDTPKPFEPEWCEATMDIARRHY